MKKLLILFAFTILGITSFSQNRTQWFKYANVQFMRSTPGGDYGKFLKEFGYKAFIYHYGFILENHKKNYYDMELGFTNGDYVAEYVKKVDEVKGECQNIYKKGKLKN